MAEGGKAIHFGVFLKAAEVNGRKVLSLVHLVQRSHSFALEFGASSLSGLLAFGYSGALALPSAWMGVLVGPGDSGYNRGLDPAQDGRPLLEAGPTLGSSLGHHNPT